MGSWYERTWEATEKSVLTFRKVYHWPKRLRALISILSMQREIFFVGANFARRCGKRAIFSMRGMRWTEEFLVWSKPTNPEFVLLPQRGLSSHFLSIRKKKKYIFFVWWLTCYIKQDLVSKPTEERRVFWWYCHSFWAPRRWKDCTIPRGKV